MKGIRLLVADDHAVVRHGLKAMLEAQPGWTVCGEAITGREAIVRAAELKPDVVVLDISMPVLNGLDAAPGILKASPDSKILIMTMHSSDDVIDRVLRSGARGIVLKSDAERDLVAAVESLVHGKPFFTSVVAERMLGAFLETGHKNPEDQWAATRLSAREKQVVQMLAEGKTNKEVAASLGISTRTVESHRLRITKKLGCHSFSDLLRYAIRSKMIEV